MSAMGVSYVEHADTVVNVVPVWATTKMVYLVTGIDAGTLRHWVAVGDVRAKKADPDVKQSRFLLRVSDVLERIEQMPDAVDGRQQ